MDWGQGGDSMTSALAALGSSPADGNRSNSAAGDPFLAGRQIDGVGAGAVLPWQPSIQDTAHVLDETTYCNAHMGLVTPPATLRGANTCVYGPVLNPDVSADDSGNVIVVPGWKKRNVGANGPDTRTPPSTKTAIERRLLEVNDRRGAEIFEPLSEKEKRYPLPPSVLRLAPTLQLARIGSCDFPKEIAPSLNFPLLRQLNLGRVSISEDVFSRVLSGCHVLENLYLSEIHDVGCLRICSPTLRIIVISCLFEGKGELVIMEAPRLERLLLRSPGSGSEIIRVVSAPKLEMLGLLSPCISEIEIANIVFQGMTPSISENLIHTVKILALKFSGPALNAVLDILRCFPCLEKLYVIWDEYVKAEIKNVGMTH